MIKLLCKIPGLRNVLTKRPRVHLVHLSGVLMPADQNSRRPSLNLRDYKDLLDEAFSHPSVNAIGLIINSPGGSPVQSDLLASYIRRLKDKHDVELYAFVEDIAASGGYWLACAADKIYASPASIVGSIGVISASFGFQKLIKNYGVERRVHTSGEQKGFLDPFMEEQEKDVKRLKTLQKGIHKQFINWVKQRRGDHLKGADKTLFEGQFWLGEDAIEKGIIDALGTYHDVFEKDYGESVKFKHYQLERGFFSSLFRMQLEPDLKPIEEQANWARYKLQ